MLRPGAAAGAGQVQPAVFGKTRQGAGQHLRRLVIVAVLVGQAGIGRAGNVETGQALQRTQMIRHKLRAGGAVEAHPQQLAMGQRSVPSFGVLARQQGSHRLYSALHRHRNNGIELGKGAVNPLQPRLDVDSILAGFQQQHIGAAFNQAGGLLVIVGGQLVKGKAAGYGYGTRSWPHCAGHKTGFALRAGGGIVSRGAGNGRRFPVDAPGLLGQAVLPQHEGRGPKGVGFNNVGAGRQVRAVDLGDDVGPCNVQIFVATLVFRAPEIVRPQAARLNFSPHRAVHNQNAMGERRFQFVRAFRSVHISNLSAV